MRYFLQAASKICQRWSSMLAVALVLLHAAPALACASSEANAGCCENCNSSACPAAMQDACLENQPAPSMAACCTLVPVAPAPSNAAGPDADAISRALSAGVVEATRMSPSLAPQIGGAPPLYLLLEQLRL